MAVDAVAGPAIAPEPSPFATPEPSPFAALRPSRPAAGPPAADAAATDAAADAATLEPVGGPARLGGYTVAVASEHRRHQLAALLEGIGARTVSVQAIQAFSPADERDLRAATLRCAEGPIDELVVTSDFGFRAWMGSARGWRLDDQLTRQFGSARLLASTPRAADSLRDIGLREIWSTSASRTEDLFRYLMAQPLRGRRVVVQSDNVAVSELCHALRSAGADVVEVPTYQCRQPAYAGLLRRLGDHIVNRQIDAVALIGAAGTQALIDQAVADRRGDAVLKHADDRRVRGRPGPAVRRSPGRPGGTGTHAGRPYLRDVVALVEATVPAHTVRLTAGGRRIEIRGQAVVLDGELIPVQPGPIAVLRALAHQPGRVLSPADIRQATPNWASADDHAIEMAVSRLRRSLHEADVIQTVMKRGYRLVP